MVRRKASSLKGLGAKYGATVRKRYTRAFIATRSKKTCPTCGSVKLSREAVGVWRCRRCGYTVAGGAYTL